MAKLHPKPYSFTRSTTGYSMAGMDEEVAELRRLTDLSDKLPDGEIVGGVLSFPIADGNAKYLVTSKSPLTLQHIPFFDGYAIDGAHVRGLRAVDIAAHLERDKRMHSFFRKKSA